MTPIYFPVSVKSNGVLPEASDAPVVFHGVNKSGSLAISNVIRDSYFHARRAYEFFSTYHESPRTLEAFVLILNNSTGHNFFVSHYIYKRIELPPRAVLVTQFRHPLSRTLSVYGWHKRNYIRRHGSDAGFPDLEKYVISTRGKRDTQMAQVAHGYPVVRVDYSKITSEDVLEIATENLERDFSWFGLADFLEESIFCLAHVCGLVAVAAWKRDTRNKWRPPPVPDLPMGTVDLIHEIMRDEMTFYERAVALFRKRIAKIGFSDTLRSYKDQCASEYVERLTPGQAGLPSASAG